MVSNNQRVLTALQVAVAIVTVHYGIGILIGTGQDIANFGPAGLTYAISAALGTLAILIFSDFYWKHFLPIWDLFKAAYGKKPATVTAFLSSFWMIGVIASFLLSGQAAANIFGISKVTSTGTLVMAIYAFSLLTFGWLSKVFLAMLLLGSLFLVIALFQIGGQNFFSIPHQFLLSLPGPSVGKTLSVFISTVLVTVIGMDFHQFVVRAKTQKTAQIGITIATLILLFISFLLGAIVVGFLPLLPKGIPGAEVVPAILAGTGNRLLGSWGSVFVLPIIFVAVGSGSGLLRIVSESVGLLSHRRFVKNKFLVNAALLFVAFLISLTSQSVVGLITAFYAMYVGAVFIPFLFYLLARKYNLVLKENVFLAALATGFFTGVVVYVTSVVPKLGGSYTDLVIILSGSLSSGLVLINGLKRK